MRNQEWDSTLAQLDTADLAKLVLGLLASDAVDGEASLGVVDEAEVLASLLDRDHVLETGGVGWVSADLAIDLDQALHDNRLDLAGVERILQAENHRNISGRPCSSMPKRGVVRYRLRMKTISGKQSRSL